MNKFNLIEIELFTKHIPTSYSQFLRTNKLKRSLKEKTYTYKEEIEASVDIELFRRTVTVAHPQLYTMIKWKNAIYRTIFFGFGLLFLVLGVILYFKTTNFACGLYFGDCSMIKEYVNGTCLLLAGGAFFVSCLINPDQEALRCLVGKVERELEGPARKLIHQINRIFSRLN